MQSPLGFITEKGISLTLVSLAVFFLSPSNILMLFVVLGQAHFFIAYLYQYRAGKITKRYLFFFVLTLIASLTVLLYFNRLDLLVIAAGTIFALHFLQDELFLAGQKPSLLRTFEMAPVFLLYSGLLVSEVLRMEILTYATALAAIIVIIYGACMAYLRKLPDLLSAYFLGLTSLLFTIVVLDITVSIRVLIGALVLLHYSTWYIQYFYKVRSNPERLTSYVRSVLACNLLAISLYALFLTPLGKPWLFVLFTPAYFYIWTLQHILFSIRWPDWRGSFAYK